MADLGRVLVKAEELRNFSHNKRDHQTQIESPWNFHLAVVAQHVTTALPFKTNMNSLTDPTQLIQQFTTVIPLWFWLIIAGVIVIAFPWYIIVIILLWLSAELVLTAIAVRQFLQVRQ